MVQVDLLHRALYVGYFASLGSKPSDTGHVDDFIAAVRVSDVDAATKRCI